MNTRTSLLFLTWLSLASCKSAHVDAGGSNEGSPGAHSSSLALSTDDASLYVVNADADSISEIDPNARTLTREILLTAAHPTVDANGHYTPAIMPRAIALSPDGATAYVSGERASALLVVDLASGTIRSSVSVGSEPIGVVISRDGKSIYVACSQDATVVKIDATSLAITGTAVVPKEPWALAWSGDGQTLLTSHFMGPGVSAIDPGSMTLRATWTIPDTAPRGDKRLAHGTVRGLYDLAVRPTSTDIWITHALLGVDSAQPVLDFESTAFPALSLLRADGTYETTLTTDAQDVAGIDGAFADVLSGPQAFAFTRDGAYALVADANSEDVLVVDANAHVESSLVRPMPGTMPAGIVLSNDEQYAFVDERSSSDVAVLKIDRSSGTLVASVDGAVIPRFQRDPMPMPMRLGQQLFNSANSSSYPLTTDHWIACATCHMEGRSDEVTWKFAQGPRDTPSNAGGTIGTGFLFRTADRNQVQDYWHTINIEQGGRFDATSDSALLDAIAAYVNYAIPLPVPPTTDPTLVARGAQVFTASGCATCHSGPRFTDSGQGNPTLDLAGTIVLHDVGTCVIPTSGAWPDVAHLDVDGDPRAACMFDTPSLNGIASSPPYLHDGSASTLADAVSKMPNAPSSAGSPSDLDAIVEYLRSL